MSDPLKAASGRAPLASNPRADTDTLGGLGSQETLQDLYTK